MTMNKQERDERAENNALLDFRESRMTWKQFAWFVLAMWATYVFFVGLTTIFGW